MKHYLIPQAVYAIVITARKRNLGQGNIFIGVCQEFCSQGAVGVCLSACWDTPPREQTPMPPHPPPPRSTPPEQTLPWEQTHPP